MGIATGEAELRDRDYFGTVLNRTARVMAGGAGSKASRSTRTDRGTPCGGHTASAGQSRPAGAGRNDWYSTDAASTALVETGVRRKPVMQREYQSIPTVSCTPTHRNEWGSIANTSRQVVSINKYSPGLAGCSFP